MILPASYDNGFAPRDGSPLYPELWRGCVGAWNFGLGPSGLTLRDWSGFGNHGTLMSGTVVSPAFGRYSAVFDGIDDIVNLGASRISGSGPRSVTVHGRFNTIASGGVNRIIYSSGNVGSVGRQFEFGQSGISGNWYFQGYSANFTTSVLGDTLPHAHTLTYDGSIVRWYLDGAIMHASGSLSLNTDGSIHAIGYDVLFSGSYLNGSVGSLVIHDRVLSSNEIRLLALRPGIAYELAPRRRSSSGVAFNRRRRLLLGAS
jgi:hypothetical protein